MPTLRAPLSAPLPAMDNFLGIGIYRPDPAQDQRHVALIYRVATNSAARVSHLRWHLLFTDEVWQDIYFWESLLASDDINRPVVVAKLIQLRDANPPIPYGFYSAGCRFVQDPATGQLSFVTDERGSGLTCATYVHLIFQHLGLPILDLRTWPPSRPSDALWRASIIERLQAYGASSDHVDAVTRGAVDSRVRPEELVSGAIQTPWPITFEQALPLAQSIVQEIG